MIEKYAVVVAGGRGKRMGSETPKQFLSLNGKAILLHSLEAFRLAIPDIHLVLVLPEDQQAAWQEIAKGTAFEDLPIAIGGKERSDSVKAGLELVPEGAIVGIHDAVRPLVSKETIKGTYEKAAKKGNAIPVIQPVDSLRKKIEEGSKAVKRDDYLIVQTPQCFRSELIKKAYTNLQQASFTDDASLAEANGIEIQTVEGNPENIKITQPQDLKIAEILLERLR